METIISVEADSIEKAREQLQAKKPKGYIIDIIEVFSDNKVKFSKGIGASVDDAFAKAKENIDPDLTMTKTVLENPSCYEVQIQAFDEKAAKTQVINQIDSTHILKDLKLVTSSTKGLMGLGKKPNQYKAVVVKPAVVEIAYRLKTRISAKMVPLSDALTSSNEKLRSLAIQELGETKGPERKDFFIEILRNPKESQIMRESAAKALSNIADSKAVAALVEALDGNKFGIQYDKLEDLIQSPDHGLDLASSLRENLGVQWSSAEALAKLGNPNAVGYFLVITDYWRYFGRDFSNPYPKIEDRAKQTIQGMGEAALNPLVRFTKIRWNPNLDRTAFSLLSKLGKCAAEPLAKLLPREDAAKALKSMGYSRFAGYILSIDSTDFGSLVEAFEKGTRLVQEQAIKLLGGSDVILFQEESLRSLHDPRGVEYLLAKLDDAVADLEPSGRKWIGHSIIETLGSSGDQRAVKPLSNLLEKGLYKDSAKAALERLGAIKQIRKPEELVGLNREVALALKEWYRERAIAWWRNGKETAICDDCNRDLSKGEGYLRPGGYLCCEESTNVFLVKYVDWNKALQNLDSALGPGIPDKIKKLAATKTNL